ncbi:MAG TPA: Xaa-Pro peptidase family protein [Candidatus Dormibacteraeota bacterium]
MIDRLRTWLQESGAGAAWISDPVSIAYLTGFHTEPHERLMGLAVRAGGAVLVVPGLEEDAATSAARGVEVLVWRDGEHPFGVAARALAGAEALAVEKHHLTLAMAEALSEAAGVERLVDAGPTLLRMRLHKSEDEVERLRRAAEATDRVTAAIIDWLHPGQTELEVAARLSALIGGEGCTLSFESIVQAGPNSALPHLRPTGRRLQRGDLVLLDFGAAWQGYRADTTRMAVIGEPDARQVEVNQVVLQAHDAAIARVRAGVTTGQVDAAAREVIERAGLGDRFIHRVGHGLGLEAHEAPSLDPGSELVLEPGMVITIEPGVYIPGWGGVRIEDDVVVDEGGARVLTSCDRSLRVVEA